MFAVKKRLDNAFDSCSNQGQAREFSLWWWTQASHSPKETESGRRFWPFHPIEQGLWGPSWYNNGLLIPNPPGRCTSPNTALVGQSGHHSWNSKQLRWIESHSWCPDWPTRAVLGGTPTLRVGYYLNDSGIFGWSSFGSKPMPTFASWSANSFPTIPTWPFTQCIVSDASWTHFIAASNRFMVSQTCCDLMKFPPSASKLAWLSE